MIGSMEHENAQKNSKQNFLQLDLATPWMPGSMTLSPGVFELQASVAEARSLLEKGNKRRKIFKRNEKPTDVGHFLVQ